MKLIYISGPYTSGDVAVNVRSACLAGDAILEKGYIPIVPHLTHFWHCISPKSWETWIKIDTTLIPFCDAVLRLDGISDGADIEVACAKKIGIPVYYSLEEIP